MNLLFAIVTDDVVSVVERSGHSVFVIVVEVKLLLVVSACFFTVILTVELVFGLPEYVPEYQI